MDGDEAITAIKGGSHSISGTAHRQSPHWFRKRGDRTGLLASACPAYAQTGCYRCGSVTVGVRPVCTGFDGPACLATQGICGDMTPIHRRCRAMSLNFLYWHYLRRRLKGVHHKWIPPKRQRKEKINIPTVVATVLTVIIHTL
jgi:hypothetical protein